MKFQNLLLILMLHLFFAPLFSLAQSNESLVETDTLGVGHYFVIIKKPSGFRVEKYSEFADCTIYFMHSISNSTIMTIYYLHNGEVDNGEDCSIISCANNKFIFTEKGCCGKNLFFRNDYHKIEGIIASYRNSTLDDSLLFDAVLDSIKIISR